MRSGMDDVSSSMEGEEMNGWITDRTPTEDEVKEAGDVGFILCASGWRTPTVEYDHAILMFCNYFEDGEWYIEGVGQHNIVIHGWMMPPSWEDMG